MYVVLLAVVACSSAGKDGTDQLTPPTADDGDADTDSDADSDADADTDADADPETGDSAVYAGGAGAARSPDRGWRLVVPDVFGDDQDQDDEGAEAADALRRDLEIGDDRLGR
jgi:hypothetical protein